VTQLEDALAPAFDLPGNARVTPGDEPPAARGDRDAIVADQPREKTAAVRLGNQL
jgi:hypothetical protein